MKGTIVTSDGQSFIVIPKEIHAGELTITIDGNDVHIEIDNCVQAHCGTCVKELCEGEVVIWDSEHEQWFCSEECQGRWYIVHKGEWRRVGKDGKPMSAEEDV